MKTNNDEVILFVLSCGSLHSIVWLRSSKKEVVVDVLVEVLFFVLLVLLVICSNVVFIDSICGHQHY